MSGWPDSENFSFYGSKHFSKGGRFCERWFEDRAIPTSVREIQQPISLLGELASPALPTAGRREIDGGKPVSRRRSMWSRHRFFPGVPQGDLPGFFQINPYRIQAIYPVCGSLIFQENLRQILFAIRDCSGLSCGVCKIPLFDSREQQHRRTLKDRTNGFLCRVRCR